MDSATPPTKLNVRDRRTAFTAATKSVARRQPDETVIKNLVKQGIEPDEARRAVEKMHGYVETKRAAHASKQRNAKIFPIIMIVVGIALCLLGLAIGRIQSVLIGGVNVAIGVMNYNKATQGSFVATLTAPPGL